MRTCRTPFLGLAVLSLVVLLLMVSLAVLINGAPVSASEGAPAYAATDVIDHCSKC